MKQVFLGALLVVMLVMLGTGPDIQRNCADNCIPLEALCLPGGDDPLCVSPYEVGSREVETIKALWHASCGGCQ